MPGYAGLAANELADGYAMEATAEAILLGERPKSYLHHTEQDKKIHHEEMAACLVLTR